MTDKNSGKKFYYNVKTRKTQWEKPAEFETSGRAKKTSNAGISSSETMDKDATNEAESESAAAEERQQRLIQQVTGSLAQTQIHSEYIISINAQTKLSGRNPLKCKLHQPRTGVKLP